MAAKIMYKVQIGAYSQKSNAQKMVDKLKKAGIPATIVTESGLMKVQCGAFSVKANAEKRLAEVKKKGYLSAIIKTVPGTDSAPSVSAWAKVLAVLNTIMAEEDPHQKVIDLLKKHGHTLKASSAWCSETVVAAFLEAGYASLIGGYAADAPTLKKHAKNLDIWHSGSSGIKAGDIVLYGSGDPNHTEIAIDGTYNISGNYNGTVKKRKRSGRTINGFIRPKYPDEEKDEEKKAEGTHRIRVAALAFFDTGDESSQYGDCTAIIEYGDDDKTVVHAVLIDCGMSKSTANIIKKLKALGVTRLDAIVISHAHGDHYGGATDIIKAFPTKDIYVADPGQIDKYQKSYGDALRRQHKKAAGHWITAGTSWTIGGMRFECIYQCKASDLKEHDDHHFINNESVVLQITLNGWVYHTAGDLQNEGNNLLIKAVSNLKADVMKCQWHGDANACNEAICKAVKPLIAFSNYHHKEQSGRGTTRKRLEAVGAVVARNHENGDVYIDCLPGVMKLTCSKGNLSKTFTKTVPAVPGKWSSYKVSLSTKVKPEDVSPGMLLALEPEDYSKAEIAALKAKGAFVLGYLSAGSVSDERPYYKDLKPYALGPLEDWPHEKYIDLRRSAVREWCVKRAEEIKAMGCDGWWVDNLDIYEEYKSSAMYEAVSSTLTKIKTLGGYVMVNGGTEYLQKAMDADSGHAGLGNVDGVTQEEVFSRITEYSGTGEFGAQDAKDSEEYQSHMKRVIRHGMQAFLLEYTSDNTLKLRIKAFCTSTGAMAYVANDVDL